MACREHRSVQGSLKAGGSCAGYLALVVLHSEEVDGDGVMCQRRVGALCSLELRH